MEQLEKSEQLDVEIYVSIENGSDAGEGSFKSPLQTLEASLIKARELASQNGGRITVILREGVYKPAYTTENVKLFNIFQTGENTYPLRRSSLYFEPFEGQENAYLLFKSFPGEKAVISGGRRLEGWELHDPGSGLYRVFTGTDTQTRQLYINGRRAVRARREGNTLGLTGYNPDCHKTGGPAYITEDLSLMDIQNMGDVELVYPNSFTMSRCTIDHVERDGNKVLVYMTQPGWYYVTHKFGTSARYPQWAENALEFLTVPGQWYLNRKDGYLYYLPLPEEDMAHVQAVIPEIDVLLSVKGHSPDNKVKNIGFQGIDFEYAGWLRPSYANGHCDSQNNYIREVFDIALDSDHQSDAAIELEYGEGISFEDCRFTKMGITALRITKSCHNTLVKGCEIGDISGGGISIGDPEFRSPESKGNYLPEKTEDAIMNTRICQNYIHDTAVEYMSAAALSAAFTVNTEISNNEILNCPYSGLHIGYGWNVIDTSCTRGMKIVSNVVDTFMTRLFDGGGMYFIGPTGGNEENPNIIRGNVIRNQVEPKYGGFYFDEGSSNWIAEGNVFENTEMWCNISGVSVKVHDISIKDTWLSEGYLYYNPALGQKNVSIEKAEAYPIRTWPEKAEEVLSTAGLTGDYARLREDYSVPEKVWFLEEALSVKAGEEKPLAYTVRTVRGVKIESFPTGKLRFHSSDNRVAEVNSNGMLKGISFGRCTLEVSLDGSNESSKLDVFVDDRTEGMALTAHRNRMLPGTSLELSPVCFSALGRASLPEGVCYESNNEAVAKVDDKGIVRALSQGDARITAFAAKEGIQLEACFELTVLTSPTGHFIEDAPFWNAGSDVLIKNGPGWLELSTEGGQGTAVYGGRPFENETLTFDLVLDAQENELVCLYLRSRHNRGRVMDPRNEGYAVVLGDRFIELHRFNNMNRTMFYGDVFPFVALGGGPLPNVLTKGKSARISMGAQNRAEGVRLFMTVNDTPVFDYTDLSSEAITRPGYFGLTVTRGSMKLSSSNWE